MANRLLGRATIKADGRTLQTKRGCTLDPGGEQRTAVVGSRSVHGFTAELMPPTLDCRITQTAEFGLEEIRSIEDATIVFEGDDGINYVISGGFSTTTPKLAEVEGEITAQFSGTSCDRA
ncbi:phage tail tube protein [Nevskia sp.]|uniref:phage tail tube protein n=1 Tax=Nevskia sp. TaxID=1929292 RepID=UPI0025E25D06|nr:phage tail tube protein [Nevskia sp.]